MIGEDQLKLMKRSAILINTSRGAVLDVQALIKALKNRGIYGVGLDEYENEPIIEPELIEHDNVALTPHIGSSTQGTRVKITEMAVENLFAALIGKISPNCVSYK